MFAQELKRWRQRRFLTQKGLADALGSSLSTVQKWEMGHTLPYPSARRQLIEVLEVEPEELFAAIEASQAVMEETKKAAAWVTRRRRKLNGVSPPPSSKDFISVYSERRG